MGNTQEDIEYCNQALYLKGSIFFDSEGNEVLKDKSGKTFLMDMNIKAHWRSVESILSRPGTKVATLEELIEKIPKSKRNNQTHRILSKFIELDLIGIR